MNEVVSFLKKVGSDAEKVFRWLASPQGQRVVQTGEGIAEVAAGVAAPAAAPEIDAAIALANAWMEKAITLQTVATAASSGTGSGGQKAAAVIAAVSPYISEYVKAAGASPLTQEQIAAANNAIVAFLNALSAPGSAAPPAA